MCIVKGIEFLTQNVIVNVNFMHTQTYINYRAPGLEAPQASLVSFLASYFDSNNIAVISDLYLNYKVKEMFVLPEIML